MDPRSPISETESGAGTGHEINLLLPDSVTRPLWKSLASNFRDLFFPETFPPLYLTSRPVAVGMLVGDIVSLPWYRTVFTNLGNVITPETLPPLQLESRPVDVGELVSDQIGHMWWSSLLRNLADRIAPERLPALQLTSSPVDARLRSGKMQLVRWSSLVILPKVPLADQLKAWSRPLQPSPAVAVSAPPQPTGAGLQAAQPVSILFQPAPPRAHGTKLQSALSRSRLREAFLISVAAAEALYLMAAFFGLV